MPGWAEFQTRACLYSSFKSSSCHSPPTILELVETHPMVGSYKLPPIHRCVCHQLLEMLQPGLFLPYFHHIQDRQAASHKLRHGDEFICHGFTPQGVHKLMWPSDPFDDSGVCCYEFARFQWLALLSSMGRLLVHPQVICGDVR